MQMGPEFSLLAVFFFVIIASANWRRRRIRRAVRDLATRDRRLLGPDPFYVLPEDDPLPEGLQAFAALQARVDRIVHVLWGAGFVYLAFVVFLILRGGGA